MDVLRLYIDYGVPIAPAGHKHNRTGWVNTICPFCTGHHGGYHLGYNERGDYFVCWRCGGKWHDQVVATVCNVSNLKAKGLVRDYGGAFARKLEDKIAFNTKEFLMPPNTMPMKKAHKDYLRGRDFDPAVLAAEWGLLGTTIWSKIDRNDYSRRIVIPYYKDGKLVSYDTRDVTEKSPIKYNACSLEREIIPHKSMLYGQQDKWQNTGICVEGTSDVWRLGPMSFAVSGISYTAAQVREIKKHFKRVYIIFDPEVAAQQKASKLVADLRFRGVKAERISINAEDPAKLTQEEADKLVKNLVG